MRPSAPGRRVARHEWRVASGCSLLGVLGRLRLVQPDVKVAALDARLHTARVRLHCLTPCPVWHQYKRGARGEGVVLSARETRYPHDNATAGESHAGLARGCADE